MRRLLVKASALFVFGIFAGSFIPTPAVEVDTETQALTQIQSAYPYLQAVSEIQIATPNTTKILVSEESINARFVGMLSHIKWLISGDATEDEDNEIVRLNKQIYSFMDDVSEDFDDVREDINDDDGSGSGLTAGPDGYILTSSGGSTSWVATSSLGLTASATPLTDDDVTPDLVASADQSDEYCLTYEITGDTWEWQTCGTDSGFATTSLDTSLKLANILTDETGTGALVFAGSPALTGTLTAEAVTLSSTLTLSGSAANIALGSNYLSGDGGDEGIYIDSDGDIGLATNSLNANARVTLGETSTINTGGQVLVYANTIANPTAASSAYYGAAELYTRTQSGNAQDMSSAGLVSAWIESMHYGTNNIGYVVGSSNGAYNRSSGSISEAVGTETYISNQSTGSISEATSLRAGFNNTNASGLVSTQKSISIVFSNAGTVTDTYGLYVGDITSGTQTNQPYSIYASDVNSRNYFAGNTGIGTSTPNAKLTVYGSINVSDVTAGIQFGGTRYLYASTTNDSIAFGEFAGSSLTSGTAYNIAFGYEAGRSMSNANADYMTLIGYQAGFQNTGDHTSIIGFGAGYSNSGDYTSIMGPSAGIGNTGDYNNLIGAFAGRNNTGGFNNFIGHSVGFQNTGNYNNVVGYYAGYNNTGSNNDMMGYQAGRYLLASSSVVIGGEALYGSHATNFIAPNNVAIGYRAGYTADDGAGANILIGYQAADNITTGNNNIIIGYDIDSISATADNRLNIGNLIFGTGLDGTGTTLASGNVGIGTTTPAQKLQVFGNIRVGTTGSNGCLEDYGGGLIAGTCSSDEDLKENIEPIAEEGRSYLESLAALTPVTYNWNEEAVELYSKDRTVENLGLIAQDVEAQFPELVSLNDEGYRQIDFRAFPFYIIQALKEVWEKLQGHDERLENLEQENEYLKSRLDEIEDELDITPAPVPTPVSEVPEQEEGSVELVTEEIPVEEESAEESNIVLVPVATE